MHTEPDTSAAVPVQALPRQSIITLIVQHFPDGSMRNGQVRTAGPLEFMPAVAAQLLREVADQLTPRIATATVLPPNGNGAVHP